VTVDKKATIEEYLSHNINTIYHLTSDVELDQLNDELNNGAIFQFPFSYRGGLEASVGFILKGADGNTFLCVGVRTAFEFVGLKATAAVVSEEESAPVDDEDMLDFSLV
jgi:hypothetical protein